MKLPLPKLHGTFTLPDVFQFPVALPDTIYTTQAYYNVAKRVSVRLIGNPKQSVAVLITGTPGIGKSCFIPFLMIYLSQFTNVAIQKGTIFYRYNTLLEQAEIFNRWWQAPERYCFYS